VKHDLVLAGVGGQGVLSVAAILAEAARRHGLVVRQGEVHGMSQRGGAVQASLRLADAPIDGDLVPRGGADMVLGVESRGFIIGAAVALKLGIGFIPARKKGKLPAKTTRATYDLEYGTDTLEMHTDAVTAGTRVLMVDDLLATGGTMAASCDMVQKAGGQIVGVEFLIELSFLHGREKLKSYPVRSQIVFENELP
jgi:adenine phosphoribosyltransferase